MKFCFRSSFLLLFLFFIQFTYAQPNVQFSGILCDSTGTVVGASQADTVDVIVKLFDNQSGGTLKYAETFLSSDSKGVSVRNGHFSVVLGKGTTQDTLSAIVTANPHLWVEITVAGDTMTRTPLTASPYVLIGNQTKQNNN